MTSSDVLVCFKCDFVLLVTELNDTGREMLKKNGPPLCWGCNEAIMTRLSVIMDGLRRAYLKAKKERQ